MLVKGATGIVIVYVCGAFSLCLFECTRWTVCIYNFTNWNNKKSLRWRPLRCLHQSLQALKLPHIFLTDFYQINKNMTSLRRFSTKNTNLRLKLNRLHVNDLQSRLYPISVRLLMLGFQLIWKALIWRQQGCGYHAKLYQKRERIFVCELPLRCARPVSILTQSGFPHYQTCLVNDIGTELH